MNVLYVTLAIVIIDQLTKIIVKGISIPLLGISLTGMEYGQSHDVIGSFFKITFVENPGMAFGIDVGETSKLFLSLFSLFASVGIFIYMLKIKHENYTIRLSFALILAGAIGNLIDRTFYGLIYDYAPIFYGRVVDFMNVDFFDFTLFNHTYERWPIFNVADASVTVGVILLLIFHRETKTADENSGEPSVENIESIPIENSSEKIDIELPKDNV